MLNNHHFRAANLQSFSWFAKLFLSLFLIVSRIKTIPFLRGCKATINFLNIPTYFKVYFLLVFRRKTIPFFRAAKLQSTFWIAKTFLLYFQCFYCALTTFLRGCKLTIYFLNYKNFFSRIFTTFVACDSNTVQPFSERGCKSNFLF